MAKKLKGKQEIAIHLLSIAQDDVVEALHKIDQSVFGAVTFRDITPEQLKEVIDIKQAMKEQAQALRRAISTLEAKLLE